MAFSAGYGHPVHGDCVYFKDGVCTLSGVAVDQDGSACPRFTPKSASKAIQPESALPRAGQPVQVYPTRMGQGRGRGGRSGGTGGGEGMRGGRGLGGGGGLGGGRGMRRADSMAMYPPSMQLRPPYSTDRAQERDVLAQRIEELEEQLKDVRRRLEELNRWGS